MTIRQTYESIEDFAREVKMAKVQKAWFTIQTAQTEIAVPVSNQLPDGTVETKNARGVRLISTVVITAMSPTVLDEKQTQLEKQMILAGIPIQFVYSAPIAAKDCIRDSDFETFNKELAEAKESVLGDIMKIANVLLFPGSVGPVVID
jgi:hypothetical protein